MSDACLKRALVFGASGQIGDALLPLLDEAQWDVLAVSRRERPDGERLHWIHGALDDALRVESRGIDAVFSLGPLDAFAHWQERSGPVAARIVAFGSTSIATKRSSDDSAERDVVARLTKAEDALFTFGARQGVAVTVLRPTLVYGRGRDRTLTRIATIARRFGVFALPTHATGLRQPVHTDDLATAALACIGAPPSAGRSYDVPGGEALGYRDMVARTLAALQPPPRLLRLPAPLFRAAVGTARGLGVVGAINPAMLDRLDQDLVFDDGDARRDFGYSPRLFEPSAAMFTPAP